MAYGGRKLLSSSISANRTRLIQRPSTVSSGVASWATRLIRRLAAMVITLPMMTNARHRFSTRGALATYSSFCDLFLLLLLLLFFKLPVLSTTCIARCHSHLDGQDDGRGACAI